MNRTDKSQKLFRSYFKKVNLSTMLLELGTATSLLAYRRSLIVSVIVFEDELIR